VHYPSTADVGELGWAAGERGAGLAGAAWALLPRRQRSENWDAWPRRGG
jgi:hypothetical protein